MKLNDQERLAVLLAMEKAIKTETDAHNPDSARAREDAALMAAYAADGTDRRRYKVNGKSVGTLSIVTKPAVEVHRSYLEDFDAFWQWFAENGTDIMRAYLATTTKQTDFMRFVDDYALTTGEVVPGTSQGIETQPARVTTTARGFKPQDVADALGAQLTEAVAGALAASEE